MEQTQLAYVKIKMEVNLNKLKGFEISNHEESKRIVKITYGERIAKVNYLACLIYYD